MMFYYSFHYLPLGITQTICNLTPFITLILAFMINGETVKPMEILNVIISFTGVILIILSSSKQNRMLDNNVSDTMFMVAILMSFGAALTASLSVVMVRQIKHVHYSIIGFFQSSAGLLLTFMILPVYLFHRKDFSYNLCLNDYFNLAMMGLGAAL